MNVSKDDEGSRTLDTELHSILFSWNKQITPPNDEEENRINMIKDVLKKTRNSRTSRKQILRYGFKEIQNHLKRCFYAFRLLNK